MIGSKLKELRNKHKYTISQLCELLDFNPTTYAKYERDERDVSTETLSRLASFYNVSTDYLLSRESKEQTALDELVGQFNMDLLEKKIVENYFALPKKMRGDLMTFLEKSVKEVTEESKNIYLKASRSIDDRGPEIVTLTPEQKKTPGRSSGRNAEPRQ